MLRIFITFRRDCIYVHVHQKTPRQLHHIPPSQLWCKGKRRAPPPPIFIILDRDCILERMPLKEPIMLVTSTSMRPAPLAMRLRREAVCARQASHGKEPRCSSPALPGLRLPGAQALSGF